jgi:hypothetical protein
MGLRRFKFTGRLLLDLFRPGFHEGYRVYQYLPSDARVVDVTHDISTGTRDRDHCKQRV